MVLWRDRHVIYKISFCGLVLSIVAYVFGFSLPYWSLLRLRNYGYVDQTVGLWQACIHKSLTCVSNVHASNPSWINASRATCSMALLLFAVALVSGCYRNVSRYGQVNCHSLGRHIECLSVVGTVFGFVGCVIFAAEFHRIYTTQYDVGRLYWAFGVVCAALAVAGFCACVMFAFNRSPGLHRRRPATVRARGPNGFPVSIQFPTELGDERFHIPYFGDVTPDQVVYGATPMQPPSYETATSNVNYTNPPTDASEAPPLYEDVTKDAVLPPEVVAHLRNAPKDNQDRDQEDQM